jgi:hypothetical protein
VVTWERFAELARELPEVEERPGRMSAFTVGGKRFAGPSRHEGAVWTRCDPEERPLLVASSPERYRLTPHFAAASGFLLIWLEHADEDDLRERLLDAWLLQAPKRLAARHGLGRDPAG